MNEELRKKIDELLTQHVYWGYVDGVGRTRCECGEWFDTDAEYVSHQQTVLGPVLQEALRQAWIHGKRSADTEWQQTWDLVTPDEERFVAVNPYE